MGGGIFQPKKEPPENMPEFFCRELLDEIIDYSLWHTVSAIRLLSFDNLRNFGKFPRYPDNNDLVVDIDQLDRNTTFFIYISHNWWRIKGREYSDTTWDILGNKTTYTDVWEGASHPDNERGDKYKLCIEGIERAIGAYAAGTKDTYIFMDYSCLDQDFNPVDELKGQLDMIVQNCDCLFTPIYDPEIIHAFKFHYDTRYYIDYTMYGPISNYFNEYPADLWQNGSDSYLSRGWCRLEMNMAAALPLCLDSEHEVLGRHDHVDKNGNKVRLTPQRMENFSGNFKLYAYDGRRPHLLYGSYESLARQAPYILPSFHNKYNFYLTYFEKFVPHAIDAEFTVEADRAVCETYADMLTFHVKEIAEKAEVEVLKDGYEGERNEDGDFHGYGSFKYIATGDYYEGMWDTQKKSGKGKMHFGNGDVYDGDWLDDHMHGTGKLMYCDGDFYEGEFRHGLKDGAGLYTYSNEDTLYAQFNEENIHGRGIFKSAAASIANECKYDKGTKTGVGKVKYSHDFTYEGKWTKKGQINVTTFQNVANTPGSKVLDMTAKEHLVRTAVTKLSNAAITCFNTMKFPPTFCLFDKLLLFSPDFVERDEQIRFVYKTAGQHVFDNSLVPAELDAVVNSMELELMMKPNDEMAMMMMMSSTKGIVTF